MAPILNRLSHLIPDVNIFNQLPRSLTHLLDRWAQAMIEVADLGISSLELDRRTADIHGLERMGTAGSLARSLPDVLSLSSPKVSFSPTTVHDLFRRDDTQSNKAKNGSGSFDPTTVNNKAMFVLFGILAASLVVTSMWFFFWAKNGGFHFKEGDWEDYKTTVLRRKGKDGKTLSNATKSTNLGANSIVGEYDHDEVVMDHYGHDEDVRQYRHEKPARVGGLNRKADGSHYDHASSNQSGITQPAKASQKKGFFSRSEKKAPVKNTPRQPSATYSFIQGDDSTVDGSYVDDHRSRPAHHRHHQESPRSSPHREYRREHHQRTSRSPRKAYRDNDTSSEPTSYGDGSTTYGDSGTKSYHHVIPGLSKGTRTETATEESRSERKARAGGYRRGGGRRRDSLSDSEGETRQ